MLPGKLQQQADFLRLHADHAIVAHDVEVIDEFSRIIQPTFGAGDPPMYLRGRIDRIDSRPDGTVAIIDYKTGKAREEDDADKSLQLSLYAIAAKEKWGYDVSALIFHNLEGNVPVITTRAASALTTARDLVNKVAQGIANGVFEAKPGNQCNFCAYRSLCPEKEKRIPHRAEVVTGRSN